MPRIAVIDEKICSPVKCQIECIKSCPVNRLRKACIVLKEKGKKESEKAAMEISAKGDEKINKSNAIAFIDTLLCIGCGICVKKCPFHAIEVIKWVEADEKKLVFSYGKNSFKLYNVAIPKKGIVAIIGENGCGKTTNTKLLAGTLKPERFPTKESEEYFKNPANSVVVKPQELAAPKGGETVGEILKKMDGKEKLEELKNVFDLQTIWSRKLEELSGGELQKVVVTASLLKEKETYVLDEPFAFLDYAYRIRAIEYLKKHFQEKRMLVVDHDISLLSYLCPQAYVFYGVPSVYGIVSNNYATDRAINMFLEGEIKPENVRFRDEKIAYKHYTEEKQKDVIFKIGKMEVKKGNFKVSNPEEIKVYEGEIVAIAGRNGIGKSTLCNEIYEKSREKCVLKKQIFERSRELVGGVLGKGEAFSEAYKKSMNLDKLAFQKTENLSGGELQKVEIFKALSEEEKTLYILDEPTNMLDVTARIRLSKLLRERVNGEKAVLLVDHDLEFVHNTADRIIIISGESGKEGKVEGIYDKDEGIRRLMKDFDLSYRRDEESNRLKLNKKGSKKDEELKRSDTFIEKIQ